MKESNTRNLKLFISFSHSTYKFVTDLLTLKFSSVFYEKQKVLNVLKVIHKKRFVFLYFIKQIIFGKIEPFY